MIAIVVISTVLAGAFLVSRSSIKNVRNSEEHSQALKLVQGQIELLRTAATTKPESSFGGTFCMSGVSPVSSTSPACKSGNLYALSIKNVDATNHTYQATAQWDSITGGVAKTQLSYRVIFAP
jgi:type II secretory pathway pseudopilin PulG